MCSLLFHFYVLYAVCLLLLPGSIWSFVWFFSSGSWAAAFVQSSEHPDSCDAFLHSSWSPFPIQCAIHDHCCQLKFKSSNIIAREWSHPSLPPSPPSLPLLPLSPPPFPPVCRLVLVPTLQVHTLVSVILPQLHQGALGHICSTFTVTLQLAHSHREYPLGNM